MANVGQNDQFSKFIDSKMKLLNELGSHFFAIFAME